MAEFLIEILTEEIPARMQENAAKHSKTAFKDALVEAKVEYKIIKAFAGARRLTIVIDGLDTYKASEIISKRGPRIDANKQAIAGFAKGAGLEVSELITQKTDKGEFYFAITTNPEIATATILKQITENILHNFHWPKSMRWNKHNQRWVRPINNILCLFDTKIISLEFAGLTANNQSYGHRFHASDNLTIKDFADYQKQLSNNFVILSMSERKQMITEQIEQLLADNKAKIKLQENADLLDETVGLVEYPNALLGGIDQEFMQLPPEVLSTAMHKHQKYFSILDDKTDKLAPFFITVANIKPSKESDKNIIIGNQRVLRARLSDAKFFYAEDCKTPLIEHAPALAKIIFHDKLGTLADKVQAMVNIGDYLGEITNCNQADLKTAITLSKLDLNTNMVKEFPALQGIMGYYYALNDQYISDIAIAIKEHYQPIGMSHKPPSTTIGSIVAISDKINTICAMFVIDEKPTGSKDPFALRRAALGIIKIILDNKISNINLYDLVKIALLEYQDKLKLNDAKINNIAKDITHFFIERLKFFLRSQDIAYDVVDATLSNDSTYNIFNIAHRATILNQFLDSDLGNNLKASYKRATNILEKSATKYKDEITVLESKTQLQTDEAIILFDKIIDIAQSTAIDIDDYTNSLSLLTTLSQPLDNFFANTQIISDDDTITKLHLSLLTKFTTFMNQFADFSQLEG